MDSFLESVERHAFRISLVAIGHQDDALDIVQEAMTKFVRRYSRKPREQWKPLFFKILYNEIKNLKRKRALKNRWFGWFSCDQNDDRSLEQQPDRRSISPEHLVQVSSAYTALEKALGNLSLRQQQAFMLRAREGLSVAETASVMHCSQGSVKTHYHRAITLLKEQLGEHWP